MLQYSLQPPNLSLSSRKDTRSSNLSSSRIFSKPCTTPLLPPLLHPHIDHHLLSIGDLVGHDLLLQGEPIRHVSSVDFHHPALHFEVVRPLGTGSYAVVYLVREVLSRDIPSEDGHLGSMDFDGKPLRPTVSYGRDYAIKCLSKANLDTDALAAQLSEVTIHQSLPSHTNIVTLHRTYETSSFLLLLLEYVPGQDLFYFLEQARDHYDSDPIPSSDPCSRTPPSPSLLASLHPTQLLSQTRLRLIASMFAQMCDAVATCHDHHIFHRDIKPENFIVTDGWSTLHDRRERKVLVKLTDFGLSTTDLESSDMDCGSAPYMSFECRNNVAPFYKPRAADVWSLGIVLINMLYHYNPWTDTAEGACSSFDLYRSHPTAFFMQRFTGMTHAVADFLANRVFCILPSDDPSNDSARVSAREFGKWAKDLPTLFGSVRSGHKRVISTSSTQGHPLTASRPASAAGGVLRTPILHSRGLSRAPSIVSHAYEEMEKKGELETVIDQEADEQDGYLDQDRDLEEEPNSRATSTTKRRKRGARKGRGGVSSPVDDTLATLAVASQSLAREMSKASRSSSLARPPSVDVPVTPVVTVPPKKSIWKLGFGGHSNKSAAGGEEAVVVGDMTNRVGSGTANNVTNLIMGLNATPQQPAALTSHHAPVVPTSAIATAGTGQQGRPIRSAADQASTWTRGRRPQMSAAYAHPGALWGPVPGQMANTAFGAFSTSTIYSSSSSTSLGGSRFSGSPPRHSPPRGVAASGARANASGAASWRSGGTLTTINSGGSSMSGASSISSVSGASVMSGMSSATTTSTSSGASTISSMSSGSASSSAFTRYSNSSLRSVSTMATSVSSNSWRAQKPQTTPPQPTPPQKYPATMMSVEPAAMEIPKNIKIMSGVPWELDELPRQLHPNPVGDIFGAPPMRKQRTRKGKDSTLDTICERPTKNAGVQTRGGVNAIGGKSGIGGNGGVGGVGSHGNGGGKEGYLRRDAATSTTDLDGREREAREGEEGEGPKKVQKGQIHALAKMLSALRR